MPLKNWNPADFPEEQEKGLPKWKEGCHVRELLWGDLLEGKIPRAHQPNVMDTREMFLSRPEYRPYGFKNFYDRLHALRVLLDSTESKAKKDTEAFKAYVKNHPASELCSRGHIHWEGSEAQKQLKMDVSNEEHLKTDEVTNKKVTPRKLWSRPDRPECRQFPPKVFRGHICQEIKTRKFHNCLNLKEEHEKNKRLEKYNKAMEKTEKTKQKEKEKQHMGGLIKCSTIRKKLHEEDLRVELLHRGMEKEDYVELRTFTDRKKMLKQLEEDSVSHEPDWIRQAATKGFKKLSAAEFNIPNANA